MKSAMRAGEKERTKMMFTTHCNEYAHPDHGTARERSTTGGTSDARFLRSVCPVIEFGLVNATMHKRDEAVAVDDLDALARIYRRIASSVLAR